MLTPLSILLSVSAEAGNVRMQKANDLPINRFDELLKADQLHPCSDPKASTPSKSSAR